MERRSSAGSCSSSNGIELASRSAQPQEAEESKRNKNTTTVLWITYLNVILYSLCYQLQQPVEPFLVKQLAGAADHSDGNRQDNLAFERTYGLLQAFFYAIQTVGCPLVGILLDRIGIRLTSAIVFCASGFSYALLASANTLTLLFVSKIPTALQAGFLVAQATATTVTATATTDGDGSLRAQALGRMTTAFTIGAAIGPALGGYLAGMGDLYIGARLAVLGSLVSVALSLWHLPDLNASSKHSPATLPDQETGEPGATILPLRPYRGSWFEDLKHLGSLAFRSTLMPLFVVKVVGGVAASMHSTVLPLVLAEQLYFDPATLGLSMSCTMLAVAVFGAFGMKPLTRALGGALQMAQCGISLRALLGIVLAIIISTGSLRSRWVSTEGGAEDEKAAAPLLSTTSRVILAIAVHGLASHALATGLTTQTTGAVEAHEQGALLGLEHSLFSLARVGGPPLGTLLYALFQSFWAVAVSGAVVDLSMTGVLIAAARTRSGIRNAPGQSAAEDCPSGHKETEEDGTCLRQL